jgi:hypothetical protein
MASIYSKSAATIIAVDSKDASEGIFRKRKFNPKHRKVSHDGILDRQPINSAHRDTLVEDRATKKGASPWTTRGWTLQELILAPHTLIYTDKRMYWKCEKGIVGQDGKIASLPGIKTLSPTRIQEEW